MKAMPKRCIPMCCILLLCGCNSVKQVILGGFRQPPQQIYQEKAQAYEKQGELQQALLSWRVAQRLDQKSKDIQPRIEALEKRISETADEHYKKGIDLYKRGDTAGARRHFLIALRIKPDHGKAFHYLKLRLPNDGNPVYKVVRGDSYTKIATQQFNDPTKAYAVAYFNNLDPEKPLRISTELVLPELPAKYIVPRKDVDALRERAQEALEQRRYGDVLKIASDIEALQPKDAHIRRLKDTVYYQRGVALLDRRKYTSAIAQLKQVSPDYPGRKKAIDKARRHLVNEATETKVAKAQHHLAKKAYAEAIAICEEILTQNPFNKSAKTIFNTAHYEWGKTLLEKGEEANAIEVLSPLDKGYKDTAQLMAQARAQLHARAETLYRKGVKFFLNEELEKAINTWSEALELNPQHPKAKQDIENAIRLLDKWRDLDENGDSKSKTPQR